MDLQFRNPTQPASQLHLKLCRPHLSSLSLSLPSTAQSNIDCQTRLWIIRLSHLSVKTPFSSRDGFIFRTSEAEIKIKTVNMLTELIAMFLTERERECTGVIIVNWSGQSRPVCVIFIFDIILVFAEYDTTTLGLHLSEVSFCHLDISQSYWIFKWRIATLRATVNIII